MNICFLAGVIISVYNFKFIYNEKSENKCIIKFKLQLHNKQTFEILAYDDMIEKVLKKKNEFVYIRGVLVKKMRIKLIEIY